MATILLSAAGAALGSGVGGSILGLSGAVVGRAIGATVGRSIDQRLLGAGSEAVEVGKVDRFHLSSVGYGTPVQEVWGRMRVAGEIIWASRFQEQRQLSGGGKGAPRSATANFSYSVSLAIALCRGEALRIGRVWADGVEIAPKSLDIRFYPGSEDQLPDPKIEAVEGSGLAPSYRGICYVVIENLPLARFGNRVPQFSFEVVRRANVEDSNGPRDLVDAIKAVALIPGSGEYALATTPVHFNHGLGRSVSANAHTASGETDFASSLTQLNEELPRCESVSLVVSWFGNDLRCGYCQVQPKVEQQDYDGAEMPWEVSGTDRNSAALVPAIGDRSIYGGTPSDRSVIEAIQAIRATGKEVMFYPFILMDQLQGNDLPDPWSDSGSQPALPWRGRITLARAPGLSGTTDQTAAAETELASFLGNAGPLDFSAAGASVTYSGVPEWSFRRFILHYAHLCNLAGGVDAFCIGSELRGLTQIRSTPTDFPMVQALMQLAGEVRAILGPQTKISYAADWSEYFGLHAGSDVLFNLDPLWASPDIDFVGIDNYMPISDWRDSPDHADQEWGAIYDLDYLASNIAGGEGFDWYYDSPEAITAQRRTAISDGAHGEDWVFRYKDINGWWSNEHFDRILGVRQPSPTGWVPGMKPIRFTEYGCAALNNATNEPNKFIDPKSSESILPRASNGRRDDFLQIQYYLAQEIFWSDATNNPEATLYAGRMVEFEKSHAWAWDARPFPDFPGNAEVWSDGANYAKGHWLNGRSSNQPISNVVKEIAARSGSANNLDTTGLFGSLRGFTSSESATGRSKLQSLTLACDLLVSEREGSLVVSKGKDQVYQQLSEEFLATSGEGSSPIDRTRNSLVEGLDRVRLTYVEAENDFGTLTAESVFPGDRSGSSSDAEIPVQLTSLEANEVVERWLSETIAASERVKFSMPKSQLEIGAGDIVGIGATKYRVERIDDSTILTCDATRVDLAGNAVMGERGEIPLRSGTISSAPVFPVFLDIPLLRGDEVAHAPHVAVTATPWPGPVSVWSSGSDVGYTLNLETDAPSIIGITKSVLSKGPVGLWDRGSVLTVEIAAGELASSAEFDVLNGANLAAIGDGSAEGWELIQFSSAVLVNQNTFELRGLLRGQVGSDFGMPESWPIGSLFVLMDGLVPQIQLSLAARGLERYYRLGASEEGYTGPNVVTRLETFNGIGLRPYSVAHLVGKWDVSGDLAISWIRRTRIDGDNWSSVEVPLGEESESYSVVISKDDIVIRETTVSSPSWVYSSSMQADDAISAPFVVSVAQNSTTFGPGPSKSTEVH